MMRDKALETGFGIFKPLSPETIARKPLEEGHSATVCRAAYDVQKEVP